MKRNKGMQSRRWLLIVGALALLLVMAACNANGTKSNDGSSDVTDENENHEATNEKDQYGGVLKIGYSTAGIQALGLSSDIRLIEDMFVSSVALESLGRYEGTKMVPHLAEKWEADPASQTITYYLREGIKFHDGTDFNAEAVKWNLENFIEHRAELDDISEITVIDEYTLEVKLKTWNQRMLEEIPFYSISSPTAYQEMGRDAVLMHPVGTGPFKFVEMSHDEYVKFERFEDYWQEGRPYLDGIEFILFADSTTASAAMKAGEIDIYFNVPAIYAHELSQLENITVQTNETGLGALMTGLIYDSANPDSPFANPKVRRAITHAIDRDAIVDALQYGFSFATTQWGSKTSPTFNPDLDLEYDPEKARQLLADAGYPNGFKTNFVIGTDSTNIQFGEIIQAYLAEVGIEVELEMIDSGRHQELTVAAIGEPWDGIIIWSARGDYDVSFFMPRTFSPQGLTYAHNLQHYEDMQELYTLAKTALTEEEWIEFSRELQRLAFDEYAIATPLYISTMPTAIHKHVHDTGINSGHPTRFTPENIWIEK